jgi:hypothetical protein
MVDLAYYGTVWNVTENASAPPTPHAVPRPVSARQGGCSAAGHLRNDETAPPSGEDGAEVVIQLGNLTGLIGPLLARVWLAWLKGDHDGNAVFAVVFPATQAVVLVKLPTVPAEIKLPAASAGHLIVWIFSF